MVLEDSDFLKLYPKFRSPVPVFEVIKASGISLVVFAFHRPIKAFIAIGFGKFGFMFQCGCHGVAPMTTYVLTN